MCVCCQLWDLKTNKLLREWKEHTAEVYAVDWNLVNKEQILSGSWDCTIKLFHPDELGSITTFKEHTKCIYACQWHPRHAEMFASTSGGQTRTHDRERRRQRRNEDTSQVPAISDSNPHARSHPSSFLSSLSCPFAAVSVSDCTLKIWDTNDRRSSLTIQAHSFEVLTCDWNKYSEFLISTGSVDKSIRTWDIRHPRTPVTVLEGHDFAVRRLKCSPHQANVLASASYDMTTMIWDSSLEDAVVAKYEDHTEFVLGVDFNLFHEHQIATTSWDETVRVFKYEPGWGKPKRQPATMGEPMSGGAPTTA